LFHPFESFRFLVEEVFSKKKVEPLNHDALWKKRRRKLLKTSVVGLYR
jgi:hypothetical protein